MTGCVATIPDDRFACSSTSECPTGFRCEAGFCRSGSGGDLDGGMLDGGGADAATGDAGERDGGTRPPFDGCVPRSCEADQCGTLLDGCGGTVSCGECPAGLTCGGDGVENVCGGGSCEPQTCEGVGVSCGLAGDGCGDVLECGGCAAGERCAAGTCVPCGDPLQPRTCSTASDCDSSEACVDGHCLAHCGDEGALRTAVGNLRGGAKAIAHFCVNTFLATAFEVDRAGCPGWDVLDIVATSPTATDAQDIVTRWPLSTDETSPARMDVAIVLTELPSATINRFFTSRADVSPDGAHAMFGFTFEEGGLTVGGELIRIRLADRQVQRHPMPGLSDLAWLDPQHALVIAASSVSPGPVLRWVRWSPGGGIAATQDLVSNFAARAGGFDILPAQGALLVGGLTSGSFDSYTVPMSELFDASGMAIPTTAIPASSSSVVTRHPDVQPLVAVGRWLVGRNAGGGGLEMRRLGGDSFTTLMIGPPMGLAIGWHAITPVGDRHVIISDSPRTLLVQLPD